MSDDNKAYRRLPVVQYYSQSHREYKMCDATYKAIGTTLFYKASYKATEASQWTMLPTQLSELSSCTRLVTK